jgi:hypothetical protein
MGPFTNTNQLMPYTEIIVILRITRNISITLECCTGGTYSKHGHLTVDTKAVHRQLIIVRVQSDMLGVACILLV